MWKQLSVLLFTIFVIVKIDGCPRTPRGIPYGNKTAGDNGYRIIIGNSPNRYVPGQIYNCK